MPIDIKNQGFGISGLFGCVLVFFTIVSLAGTANAEIRVPDEKSEIQLSFAPVVKRSAPAVVNIYVRHKVKRQVSPLFNDPFFKKFFGKRFGAPRRRMQSSLGSGVIVSADGVVITNFHVIKGGADTEIKVALSDKREFSAHVILRDEQTDLAILRIDGDGVKFPYIEFENSDNLEVGDLVLAIGNPFGVGQTVTSGIVSALARTHVGISDYQFFIQTDAAINPGNSGGALVDVKGRLVGINTAIFSRSGGSHGIGFAIPSNMARQVLHSAQQGTKVHRPWLGAKLQPLTSDIADSLGLDRPSGALVTYVHKGSPAEKAGLEVGDVVVAVDENTVTDPRAFHYRFSSRGIGKSAIVEIIREGRTKDVRVALKSAPEIPLRNLSVLNGDHPFNGAQVGNLSPAFAEELSLDIIEGVVVLDVGRQSHAKWIGLRRGDIILKINNVKIASVRGLTKVLSHPQRRWRLEIKRGKRVFRTVVRG